LKQLSNEYDSVASQLEEERRSNEDIMSILEESNRKNDELGHKVAMGEDQRQKMMKEVQEHKY
jgi:hypothetical protein